MLRPDSIHVYVTGIRLFRPLAPAFAQVSALSWIECTRSRRNGCWLSKVQALRCFQIEQAQRGMIEVRPLQRTGGHGFVADAHQLRKHFEPSSELVVRPHHARI